MTQKLTTNDRWQDDQSVWYAFQNGDRSAFEFIYQNNVQSLIRYGLKVTRDRNVIQDCIQDLFIELWESRKTLSEVGSVKYYLFKSLRYKIVRHLRQNNAEDLNALTYEVESDNFEIRFLREEMLIGQSKKLTVAIERLPKRQKEAIHLRYFQEMSNEEVARIMGVNYQSACKFIYTALKNLKEVMVLLSFFFR